MLEGLEFLDQHGAGIGSAVEQTGLANYDPKAVLGSIHNSLAGLNAQAIRKNIAQYKAELSTSPTLVVSELRSGPTAAADGLEEAVHRGGLIASARSPAPLILGYSS
jgi:hypothetical protein